METSERKTVRMSCILLGRRSGSIGESRLCYRCTFAAERREAQGRMRASMHIAPAAHGWRWMAPGGQLYRLSPGMWTLLVFTWWALIALANQVPYVGPVGTTVVLPAFMM